MFEKEIIGRRLIVILMIILSCLILQYVDKLDTEIVALFLAIIAVYKDKKEIIKKETDE